jgi:hypothetical protein
MGGIDCVYFAEILQEMLGYDGICLQNAASLVQIVSCSDCRNPPLRVVNVKCFN